MLVSFVSSEEFKSAGKISKSATLDSLRLVGSNIETNQLDKFFDGDDKASISFTAQHFSKMKELVLGRDLTSIVSVVVEMVKSDAKIIYKVDYLVKYRLPSGQPPQDIKDQDFEAFARLNGLLNAWPYVRALISSLSAEVGLPLTLPLLRIAPHASEVKAVSSNEPAADVN